ncbi:DeoR/GlpR family DNA-binding transcription regulator (plasmid) [Staphylococcus pseudoxylosus]|uniref:DeoR/GlpR family DNA-binding transcription regulator n=1 Tax=Staphylococcus pseudoxylosus TaxID=2282419 RepID=UPI0034D26988
MILAKERRNQIFENIKQKGVVYVSELSEYFKVSYETIRKDLTILEKEGLVDKTHGGATLRKERLEYTFYERQKENTRQKKKAAEKMLEFIPENSSLILGTGSTVLELAALLSKDKGKTIFTDSLPVANLLFDSDNDIFLFGGKLRNKSYSVHGGWAAQQINQINVDLCILGTDGFNVSDGPTSPSSSDTYLDQLIISRSEKCYILSDSSKIEQKSLYQICTWENINALIIGFEDSFPNDKSLAKLDNIRNFTNVYLV